MYRKELEELELIASKAEALVTVTLDSCEKNDYTSQLIALEEVQKYTCELNERLINLIFSI